MKDTQGYNRYSYVHNNPLNATDPSGFFSLKQFAGLIAVAFLMVVAPELGNIWIGAIAGGVQAAANGQNILKGAFFGAFTAAAGFGGGWQGMLASATASGIASYMQGGKFGAGFASAGVGAMVGLSKLDGWKGFMVSAMAGGTVSELTGGKFGSGAMTSAISYLVMKGAEEIKEGGQSAREQEVTNNSNPKASSGFKYSNPHDGKIGDFQYHYDQVDGEIANGERMMIQYNGPETGGKWIQSVTSSLDNDGNVFIDTDRHRLDYPHYEAPASDPFYNDQSQYFKGKTAMYDTPVSQAWRKSFVAETSYVVRNPDGGYRAIATFKWGYTTDMDAAVRTISLIPIQKVTPSPFHNNLIKSAQ